MHSLDSTLLPQLYGVSWSTIRRRRNRLGYKPNYKREISLRERLDLDSWWIATNKEWGLGWSSKQYEELIIAKRKFFPTYSLNDFFKENPQYGFRSLHTLLKRAYTNFQNFIRYTCIDLNYLTVLNYGN